MAMEAICVVCVRMSVVRVGGVDGQDVRR
ncbi:MAG: hypothetical protein RLZZ458_567, partial [Planctomycetota bacterium]